MLAASLEPGWLFLGSSRFEANRRSEGNPMLPTNGLRKWLGYEDRQLPSAGMLTIQEHEVESSGDSHAPGWRSVRKAGGGLRQKAIREIPV